MKLVMGLILSLLLSSAFANTGEWKKAHEGRMDYWIYVPAAQTDAPKPLMLSLHGCTQKADALLKGNWEKAADEYQTIVVLPYVPGNGVLVGCWDYFGQDHRPDNKHHKDLGELVEALLADSNLNIDPSRVYISGISSGGGEAAVITCLRPDLFAGAGLSSAPAIGTDQNSLQKPNVTAQEAQNLCSRYAGENAPALKKLRVVSITSDQDYVVNPQHTRINTEVFKSLTDATLETEFDSKTLPGTKTVGKAFFYSNADQENFVSLIINNGLGHNWPGGQGGPTGIPFVAGESVNFPLYVLKFFNENQN